MRWWFTYLPLFLSLSKFLSLSVFLSSFLPNSIHFQLLDSFPSKTFLPKELSPYNSGSKPALNSTLTHVNYTLLSKQRGLQLFYETHYFGFLFLHKKTPKTYWFNLTTNIYHLFPWSLGFTGLGLVVLLFYMVVSAGATVIRRLGCPRGFPHVAGKW